MQQQPSIGRTSLTFSLLASRTSCCTVGILAGYCLTPWWKPAAQGAGGHAGLGSEPAATANEGGCSVSAGPPPPPRAGCRLKCPLAGKPVCRRCGECASAARQARASGASRARASLPALAGSVKIQSGSCMLTAGLAGPHAPCAARTVTETEPTANPGCAGW